MTDTLKYPLSKYVYMSYISATCETKSHILSNMLRIFVPPQYLWEMNNWLKRRQKETLKLIYNDNRIRFLVTPKTLTGQIYLVRGRKRPCLVWHFKAAYREITLSHLSCIISEIRIVFFSRQLMELTMKGIMNSELFLNKRKKDGNLTRI